MNKSIQTAFEHIIDYAGMFPPARLPLEVSLENFLRYRESSFAWMLGRFICPVDRLTDAAAFVGKVAPGVEPIPVSVIAGGGASAEDFLSLVDDASKLAGKSSEHLCIGSFELRLPAAAMEEDTRSRIKVVVANAVESLVATCHDFKAVYFEPPAEIAQSATFKLIDSLAEAVELLGELNAPAPALKLRTGGATAEAFPSIEFVARVLAASAVADVAMKATAGLHHALFGQDEEIGAWRHGFVNMIAASAAARRDTIDKEIITALGVSDEESIAFDDDGLKLGSLHVSLDELAETRRAGFHSFGSCSFDEPTFDVGRL